MIEWLKLWWKQRRCPHNYGWDVGYDSAYEWRTCPKCGAYLGAEVLPHLRSK